MRSALYQLQSNNRTARLLLVHYQQRISADKKSCMANGCIRTRRLQVIEVHYYCGSSTRPDLCVGHLVQYTSILQCEDEVNTSTSKNVSRTHVARLFFVQTTKYLLSYVSNAIS
jgi:hypothetical protein